jgi:hypothetical protein
MKRPAAQVQAPLRRVKLALQAVERVAETQAVEYCGHWVQNLMGVVAK